MSQHNGSYPPEDSGGPTPPPGGPGYGQPSYEQPSSPYGDPSFGYGQTPPPGGPSYQTWGGYPPAYGSTGYGGPRPTNTLAIVSLVTSIIGFGIVGIITGHIARRQIRQTGEAGDGLALAGLLLGYIVTALEVLLFLLVIGMFTVASDHMY